MGQMSHGRVVMEAEFYGRPYTVVKSGLMGKVLQFSNVIGCLLSLQSCSQFCDSASDYKKEIKTNFYLAKVNLNQSESVQVKPNQHESTRVNPNQTEST